MIVISSAMPAVCRGEEIPHGRWWRTPQVAEKLQLTEEHKQKLDELFISNRRKLIDLMGEVEKARLELEHSLNNDPLDEQIVMQQFNNLEDARSKLASERFNFFINVRKLLGLERYQRLDMLYNRAKAKPQPHVAEQRGAAGGGN